MSRARGEDKGRSNRGLNEARDSDRSIEQQYAWLDNKSVLLQEFKAALDEQRVSQMDFDAIKIGLFGIATHAKREGIHTGMIHNESRSAMETLQESRNLVLKVLPQLYPDEDHMKQALDAEVLRIKQAARAKEF